MDVHEKNHTQLLSVLTEMLEVSDKLLYFTKSKYDILSGEDENELLGALEAREKIITSLINLENKIDLILDESILDRSKLPCEADKLRRSVRLVLDSVNDIDIMLIDKLRGHLQEYKHLTIQVRNKKHISAYIKSSGLIQQDNSFEFTN